ncbi:hypothetical protein EGR_01023 [Echinococcus granulosus]|uniref:Uncharacterized protein n=1 Tax=Echinococcus granulosus TaxID=6210 RepID=W6UQC2_ECHGR|nr:hypothetical protein EGR_01023 [Echinococcus granulosus]EUB63895.1 hypothetical protein EGR_01023 [Echinococcus granulosus]
MGGFDKKVTFRSSWTVKLEIACVQSGFPKVEVFPYFFALRCKTRKCPFTFMAPEHEQKICLHSVQHLYALHTEWYNTSS